MPCASCFCSTPWRAAWSGCSTGASPEPPPHERLASPAPLKASRGIVIRLAALFSIDAFAGGLVLNSLLALWLFERFGLSLSAAGMFFFWAGLLSAFSQLAAPLVARRIGLINTMVFTHIPSSLFLILAALADSLPWALGLLLARAALSQMDVPTRSAFVMAVVTPPERAAAASFTAVPRSLAAAVSPSLGGALIAAGWLAAPLIACGVLKIAYDVAIWRAFRSHGHDAPLTNWLSRCPCLVAGLARQLDAVMVGQDEALGAGDTHSGSP